MSTKKLSKEAQTALLAFLDAFEQVRSGWFTIEEMMQSEFGIDNPERAIESATQELRDL